MHLFRLWFLRRILEKDKEIYPKTDKAEKVFDQARTHFLDLRA